MYTILSPDGIPIQNDPFPTILKAYKAFVTWKNRYVKQGYYSSSMHGKIHLLDLKNYCDFIKL